MPHILLTGAGFSRNWGGWLADEAFEYLLGHPLIDDGLRTLLWRHKGLGGFEAAYDEQQTETSKPGRSVAMLDHAQRLNEAIRGMFDDMDKAFVTMRDFDFQKSLAISVTSFLTEFDAIFTLNQDLLLERQYLTDNLSMLLYPKRTGWQIPGMEPIPMVPDLPLGALRIQAPMDPSKFAVQKNLQPYFKLHGSSNWIDRSSGQPMLVIGGNKAVAIGRHEILKWNNEQFKAYLAKPDTRLMVIGYSFGDEHINTVIGGAAERGTLRVFIIDPLGVDVLRREREWLYPRYLGDKLPPYLIGASRRTLREIFGGDMVEHGKVMRF